jgi:hypothetical protein
VAKNWASSSGKLAGYSNSCSSTMYIYSSYLAAWTTLYSFPVSSQGVVTLGEGLVTGA